MISFIVIGIFCVGLLLIGNYKLNKIKEEDKKVKEIRNIPQMPRKIPMPPVKPPKSSK